MTASPDRTVFVKTIEGEPGNPLHRYVFADWLEERGDPEWCNQRIMAHAIEYGLVRFFVGQKAWKRISTASDHYRLVEIQGLKVSSYIYRNDDGGINEGCSVKYSTTLCYDTYQELLFKEEEIRPKFRVGEVVQHNDTADCVVTRTIMNKVSDDKIDFSYEVLYPGHTLNYLVESYFLSKRTEDG